jgi:hypothetical protein
MNTKRQDIPLFAQAAPDIFGVNNNFKTITIRWPVGSKIPAIRGKWKRLEDGRIEAIYTREELRICLEKYELLADTKGTK